ncbi:ArsR/SmtB family transcription factor [Burkholderia lata]|uniref:ArsR/SmtB family transcription factor n=1 Tax=Burkholderia lata (strain ATCC 17760 / DSM 23089 / LMG 22485 / NCIMB 9086 / R18194 / 383) TaxID=482957 RepID=UPI001453FB52|nr:metalloregulator ArsR/SmtB family transcription factor [Burkholderia lata]VWC00782.1 ArsR family transcriptional regulator [Burkholderia lata]
MEPTANDLFAALGEPTRRAIFQRLSHEGEQTVGRLTVHAGVSQPAVSKHLAVLRQAGLVEGRPEGRETYYRARSEGLAPLIDWLGVYGVFWRDRIDALSDLLDRMDT